MPPCGDASGGPPGQGLPLAVGDLEPPVYKQGQGKAAGRGACLELAFGGRIPENKHAVFAAERFKQSVDPGIGGQLVFAGIVCQHGGGGQHIGIAVPGDERAELVSAQPGHEPLVGEDSEPAGCEPSEARERGSQGVAAGGSVEEHGGVLPAVEPLDPARHTADRLEPPGRDLERDTISGCDRGGEEAVADKGHHRRVE